MTNSTIQAGQASASAVSEKRNTTSYVRIDYGFHELIFFSKELSKALSILTITMSLEIEIDLASKDGLRTWFSKEGILLGYVVIRSVGNGAIQIKADTVLRNLENSTQGLFELDGIEFASAWIEELATKLALIQTFWGWSQVVDAAEALSKRLG